MEMFTKEDVNVSVLQMEGAKDPDEYIKKFGSNSFELLINKAKSENISVIMVGHVNKEGSIAGPKVLEHMVDAVLYFEGDRRQAYRIIRAIKNRFGSTNEIGVFEMTDRGLVQIPNPCSNSLMPALST